MRYEPVIGLEIHAELRTKTKMFCYSPNDPNETHPNINICPVCMGHPGTLPVINEEAVKKVILTGLALNGRISQFSQFDRKNYFYPDLPKGYQISQYEHPFVTGGALALEESSKKEIRIRRIHLEEDTGRLIHDASGNSLVDFNRAGVPLMELVTEPDFRTGEEVREFGEELQRILRYIGASEANMEKGEMRVEVNISIRPEGTEGFGTKVEVKNINSFKFAADAVDYEIKRQTEALERGEKIIQETRGWNEDKKMTVSQRSKEEAHDYRYFPEPDLPPITLSEEYIEKIQSELPELPRAKKARFIKEYGLQEDAAGLIARDKAFAGYFEEVVSELLEHDKETPETPKKNLIPFTTSVFTGELLRLLKDGETIKDIKFTPENFAELLIYLAEDKISNLAAKQVLGKMFQSGGDPSDIIDELGLWQVSDAGSLESIALHIIEENKNAAEDYKAGKEASLGFLVGQAMKESRGKANPKVIRDIMEKLLKRL
ncbi:MAG: glutaminyl-tRNA synthase (glutamine-hydrolyzing) subunit B [Candidatus Sungbacteria bacterium RIFCSPHIGHO2_01_FULL_50_25]|uniref:Aspartyl/glutamyl-tRNA(Asn/Gln) amidotransferase subunit B n=1 Tax=Candidatus Sungbacteria bacterium RIFCSPHIGHO2_01_FULL_50_25 TaxID=1802265 RepID=A0A1G2K8S4_9BACT|nr:MAG: glutaminyl-tRNA synthase (glutamine-hydrolyzing) subunit B [Candidatus Sungbacteria bacterium RIFCSPHIGHO2_01_FULL_50_25]